MCLQWIFYPSEDILQDSVSYAPVCATVCSNAVVLHPSYAFYGGCNTRDVNQTRVRLISTISQQRLSRQCLQML